MNDNVVPKWQKELQSFLGIKSGIILEGNVYDEFPSFKYEGDEVVFDCTYNLDRTILKLVDGDKSSVIFFDPIDGFYCLKGGIERQKEALMPMLEGYSFSESFRNHGQTLCLMPIEKKERHSKNRSAFVYVSEIVRRVILDHSDYFNREDNVVVVLNFASRLDACNLSEAEANVMFLNLMAATTAVQSVQNFCNTVVMVVDKYNDIPAWVYLNNPNIRSVSVCAPDRNIRRLYLENLLIDDFVPFRILSHDDYEPGKQFVAETEGMKLQEIKQILQLACKKGITPQNISLAFRLYKYGVLENPWEMLENNILADIKNNLEKRVKGQSEAIEKVQVVAKRAIKGLSGLQHSGPSHKPKGILFFAGPTGVGKTETAKALAESIFGNENACIRFDMSEYRLEESEQKLFGAPPGYVGYEGGGQLTNAVKNRPFSILLFDEIEKAHPTIMDKFLQILEDGRMTDNQGNTVYFGETIIIFTSNIGLTKVDPSPENLLRSTPHRVPAISIENPKIEDTQEFREKVTKMLTEGVKSYFNDNGRPELLNRLGEDNIIVFQFINVKEAEEICEYKLKSICEAIEKQRGIIVHTQDILSYLKEKAVEERANGGRGIGNMLEREFLNPFANAICELDNEPSVLRCHITEHGVEFEVMLSED